MATGDRRYYGEMVSEQRAGDWIAFRAGDRGVWEVGRSEAEALGNLVITLDMIRRAPVAKKARGDGDER